MSLLEVAIVIPIHNEEKAIAQTIREYKTVFPKARLIIVDNNCSDASVARAQELLHPTQDLLIIERRQGKGYAVRTGLTRVDADIYMVTDGDATYSADDAFRLLERMLQLRADMVVGDRLSSGAYQRQNVRMGHSWGNLALTAIISRLSGARYADVLSGLRLLSRPFVAALDVRSTGFQFETEMNVAAAYLRSHVVEIPITYRQRVEGSHPKLHTFRDGLRIVSFAFTNWVNFAPLQAFSLFALIALLIAGALAIRVIAGFMEHGWPYTTTAVVAAAAGLSGLLALFNGITLFILGRNNRRRDIAQFLDAKRKWNAKLDAQKL